MNIDQIAELLDVRRRGEHWLRSLGIDDLRQGYANLQRLESAGVTRDLLAVLASQLTVQLPALSDADMALNNLQRFVAASRNPLSTVALMERDDSVLPALLLIFSTSQHLSDLLVQDGEAFDLLRLTEGRPIGRQVLIDEVVAETNTAADEEAAMLILRRYKRREILRIAYGDIVCQQNIETVTEQLSWLAEALCEAAIRWSRQTLEETRGQPRRRSGEPARFVALALGKLGGTELDYSSDIELVLLCDTDGKTDGNRKIPNSDFFDRLAKKMVRLLSDTTELGAPYRVELRLRPNSTNGPLVMDATEALRHYDVAGRTWERQAYVKARPLAGDIELGEWFLTELEPWIYRRYLTSADITGIKALKRRIEKQTHRQAADHRNVKTGHGGIRDIEFAIQFLQLLNGGDMPQVRTGNTLQAIRCLEGVGCLTRQERTVLEANYEFLRHIEHRLQIMFDLQTHLLPESDAEVRRLAIRLGYDVDNALTEFQADLEKQVALNRQILDHLLHDAFPNDHDGTPEEDLVLDPEPDELTVADCLVKYQFRNVPEAYRNLTSLAQEKNIFLSGRRCRHFLAAIATDLLREISQTPDPDFTLMNLSNVSESLGGKGILWELFSFNPPMLHLYVRLCASSPYLSGILTSYPGMIDELMDSLLMSSLPSFDSLQSTLAGLLKGAEDPVPILHAFKNAQHLRVGVRDLIGKDDIQQTHEALSNIAEVCLNQVTTAAFQKVVERFGMPMAEDRECELVILALGKLGGREPNYHSDLDIVFLYESAGMTQPTRRGRESTTNQHFFAQLAQRIIKDMTDFGPYGRLFELDARLRPSGRSGSLALSFVEFERHFSAGEAQLFERQALCKGRVVYGSPPSAKQVLEIIHRAIISPAWRDSHAAEILRNRLRLEKTATDTNLKRGRGGTVDIEFLVQMLQLKHGEQFPEILQPGTLDALQNLTKAGLLSAEDAKDLGESYRFLRGIEAKLRLMNTTKRHDLPTMDQQKNRLAYLLGIDRPDQLESQHRRIAKATRHQFDRFFAAMIKDRSEV
jgi:glutamate-ammonia-ligase adenylyltransferase